MSPASAWQPSSAQATKKGAFPGNEQRDAHTNTPSWVKTTRRAQMLRQYLDANEPSTSADYDDNELTLDNYERARRADAERTPDMRRRRVNFEYFSLPFNCKHNSQCREPVIKSRHLNTAHSFGIATDNARTVADVGALSKQTSTESQQALISTEATHVNGNS